MDSALPDDQLAEDEEEAAEEEVDKVLQEVLHGKMAKVEPIKPTEEKPVEEEEQPVEEDFEDQEATLSRMRGRLEALKS